MRVADRARERVGRVGRGIARQREQAPHHVLHLLLGGVAVADHRLLDLQRGVLGDRQAGEHRGADRGAARLAERERRLRVGVDEHLLDRDLAGRVRGDDLVQTFEDRFQPRGELAGAGLARSRSPRREAGIAGFDDAESGDLQPGIDAEDSQFSLVSRPPPWCRRSARRRGSPARRAAGACARRRRRRARSRWSASS